MRKTHIANAKRRLDGVRKQPSESGAKDVIFLLFVAGVKPEMIGTTRGELLMFCKNAQIALAKEYLGYLQRDPSEDMYQKFRTKLNHAKAKPEDIGTTQAELLALRREGRINDLKEDLRQIRSGAFSWGCTRIEHDLKELGEEPETIGTTWAELKELDRKQHLMELKSELRSLKSQAPESSLEILLDHLNKIHATPDDIGTTREELNRLAFEEAKRTYKPGEESSYLNRAARVLRLLAYANVHPKKIGASRKELESASRKHSLAKARRDLESARNIPRKYLVVKLRELLEETGINPEEIGTTREELKSLYKRRSL